LSDGLILAAARELAARYGAKLHARHVLSLPIGAYITPAHGEWDEVLERNRQNAENRLRSLEGVIGTAVYGVPGAELAAFSEHVSLLAVGSRNYGPVRRLIFGSTSNQLACHACAPLLVLPRGGSGRVAAIGDRD